MTLLTPLQLARKYPYVSRSTLYAALQEGTLPGYRIRARKTSRGKWLVREDAFLAWVEEQKAGGPPQPPARAEVPRLKHLPL